MDSLSRHEEIHLEEEVREGQSTVNQLTVQKKELQEHPRGCKQVLVIPRSKPSINFSELRLKPDAQYTFFETQPSQVNRQQLFKEMCAQGVRQRRDVPCHQAPRDPLRELMNQKGRPKMKPLRIRHPTLYWVPLSFVLPLLVAEKKKPILRNLHAMYWRS